MPSRNEKVNVVVGAKDQASAILQGITGKVAAIGAAYLGWNAAKGIMTDIINAGRHHEQVWTDVAAALDRHDISVERNLKSVQKFADEMQTLSGISDETIGKSVQAFVDYGNTVSQSMKLTKTALDLSVGSGMDLKSATDLLTKASVGYTSTLSRYGIIVDENLSKSDKFQAALAQINERFGGAAAARVDNFNTKLSLMKERVGDLEEQLFETFSTDLTVVIHGLSEAVGVLTTDLAALQTNTTGVADATGEVAEKMNVVSAYAKFTAQGFVTLSSIVWNAGSIVKNVIDLLIVTPLSNVIIGLNGVTSAAMDTIEGMSAFANLDFVSAGTHFKTAGDTMIATNKAISRNFSGDIDDIKTDVADIERAMLQWATATMEVDMQLAGIKPVSRDAKDGIGGLRGEIEDITQSINQFSEVATIALPRLSEFTGVFQSPVNMNDEAIKSFDEAANKSAEFKDAALTNLGQFAGGFANTFRRIASGGKITWQNMVADFGSLFLQQILTKLLPGGPFMTAFLNAFKFWDVAANDRALIREGTRAAMFITQGMTEGIKKMVPAINSSVGGAGLAFAGGGSSQNITINFNGPITDKEFIRKSVIPEIERSVKDRASRIKLDTRLSTGVADGEFI